MTTPKDPEDEAAAAAPLVDHDDGDDEAAIRAAARARLEAEPDDIPDPANAHLPSDVKLGTKNPDGDDGEFDVDGN